MKKYFFIGAVVLLVGLAINYSLGGFKTIEPKLVEVDNYIVYGKPYEGSYNSNWLTNMGEVMRRLQQEITDSTDLVIINYINKAKETVGNVDNFVGLSLKNDTNNGALDKLEKRIIKANKAIRLTVKIQPMVMPSPEKIKELAFELAAKEGLQLQQFSIEKYSANGLLIIEFPVME